MNIEQLKAFHRVAQLGGFTQAAQDLFLTQPAVSMQVRALEHSLGVSLFDRSRRKVRLTEEGEALFAYAKRIFDLFDEVSGIFQDLHELQSGRLVLGATAVMGTYLLTSRISDFSRYFPRVSFSVLMGNSGHVADLVQEGEVELGFGGKSTAHPHLVQLLMHREPFTVVVAPGSPLAGRKAPVSVDEFLRTPMVTREKGARGRDKVHSWLRRHNWDDSAIITLSNLEATKRLVAEGYGTTALPHLAVAKELELGTLVPVQVEGFDLFIEYYLLYLPGKRFSKAARAFLALLRDRGTALPGELCLPDAPFNRGK